jgi:hypothetical protein
MNCGFTYEIRDKTDKSLVYYGSSELPTLKDRMDIHIQHFNAWKTNNDNVYCSSFKVLENDNYKYDIIEVVYFDTKYELREYERPLIEGQICVNKNVPNRTQKEWYEANPNYNKDYYQENKDKMKEQIQVADYYKNNKDKVNKKFTCSCGGRYTHIHKARHIKSKKHQKWLKLQSQKNE